MSNDYEKRKAEVRERLERATEGPWNYGVQTAAGRVWVYANGSPLLEPLHSLAAMFRIRTDSYRENMPGEDYSAKNVRFWRQREADADFVAHARQDVPWLLAQLEERDKEVEVLAEVLGKVMKYRKGEPPFDFSRMDDYDRGNATFDAWNQIEAEIQNALATKDAKDGEEG